MLAKTCIMGDMYHLSSPLTGNNFSPWGPWQEIGHETHTHIHRASKSDNTLAYLHLLYIHTNIFYPHAYKIMSSLLGMIVTFIKAAFAIFSFWVFVSTLSVSHIHMQLHDAPVIDWHTGVITESHLHIAHRFFPLRNTESSPLSVK